MTTITLQEARTDFDKLFQMFLRGEAVEIIGLNDERVFVTPSKKGKRQFGRLRGKIKMHDDFDEPLEEFAEYMP